MMKSVFLGLASSLALASMSPFATSVAAQGLQPHIPQVNR